MLAVSQNPKFYAVLIDHYEERVKDKSIPILLRADFKKTIAYYKSKRQRITETQVIHSSKLLPCH